MLSVEDTMLRDVVSRPGWTQRLSQFAIACQALVLGSIAIIQLFNADGRRELLIGGVYLLIACYLLWLGAGLLRHAPRAWSLNLATGTIAIGATGLDFAVLGWPYLSEWVRLGDYLPTVALFLPIGALLLLLWLPFLLANNDGAQQLWYLAGIPVALLLFRIWRDTIWDASGNYLALALGILWFFPAAYALHALQRTYTDEAAKAKAKRASIPQAPQFFPTRYHEAAAKGRYCELFGITCSGDCPLPIRVAQEYQRLRNQFADSPDLLKLFEDGYRVLITPRLRSLCGVAHEIMRIKAKELGPKRFAQAEAYLWGKLWERLQNGEIKGDAQKAQAMKLQIKSEL